MEKSIFLGVTFFFGLVAILTIITLAYDIKYREVTSFESCVEKGGSIILEEYPLKCSYKGDIFIETEKETGETIYDYFISKIRERGSENLGATPVEGFDPDLYISAFPGIKKEDFKNAAAIGGVWELNNDRLKLVRDPLQEVTSADGTINDLGLTKLLDNLKYRLDLRIVSSQDIDNLLEDLSRGLCTEDSRDIDICTMNYDPVCGKPVNKTFSNSCSACKNKEVNFWIEGEC